MNTVLSIILLEDNKYDVELAEQLLASENFNALLNHCDSEASFRAALASGRPDLIISDFSLPSYTGPKALALARSLHPGTPFIFFSGTIGEETAIDAIKQGATDYVLKQRPRRLVTAIRRALAEAAEREKARAAEEQIRAQAQVIDLATDAIVICSLEDTIEFLNRGAERLYGYAKSELLGRKSTEFIAEPLLGQFQQVKAATLRDGHWEGEMEQYRKDQKPLLVNSRWTLVQQPGAEKILVINTDITEKKHLEKQFLRAQRLESIGTLASGIAHDLNNILAPICLATELLRSGRDPANNAQMLGIIDESARRGAQIVKQVLTFVRGSEGKRVPISVGPLIKEVANMARETFPRNIQTAFHLDGELSLAEGDASQLHQVLMNLCVNARDAMPNGGTLTLSARNRSSDAGAEVLIQVEDTGTGIPPDLLEKIFDPFFTTKELSKGTGLGLSTVMGIVKSHRGRIDVQSSVGQGTCFRIVLPAQVATAPPEQRLACAIPRGDGELILIVDDESELRKVAAQVLLSHGFDVITAPDASEAILRLTERLSDVRLVVTDVMMPGLDGASLAKNIHKLKPNLPIVSTSGLADGNQVPNASAHLKKPFRSEELLAAVSRLLSSANRRRESFCES